MVKSKIQSVTPDQLFIKLDSETGSVLDQYSAGLGDTNAIKRSTAGAVGRTFEDYDGSISVKSGYHRGDYEWFRAAERVPKKIKDIIEVCDRAYERIGIVKHVIDLMSEFTVSGIRLQHPDKSVENFYNNWFKKVKGKERSERFVNNLYRLGNTIVRRHFGTISSDRKKQWRRGKGKRANDIKITEPEINEKQIPLKYSFLHPRTIEVANKDTATLTGEFQLALVINPTIHDLDDNLAVVLRGPRRMDPGKLTGMPPDIKAAYQAGRSVAPLDPDKFKAFYYKRDDWQLWGKPITYCILADLMMYDKLKLADVSALDGVISNVRLWRLGYINESNPLHSILPTKAGINRLKGILHNNVGGGTMDLVWGPELDFKESSTEAWRWLGAEKYGPTLDAIYDGLGIPPTLRSSDRGGNNTGNFVGLQTLIERLEYGRQVLLDFWDEEIRIVHAAMGFETKPPKVMFDHMILADKAAERKLVMDLADRDIISYEAIKEEFGFHPEVEAARVKREATKRGKMIPEKASPFHNPDKVHEYKKILLQGGTVAPSEIGFKLLPKNKGELNKFEQMKKFSPAKYKPTGSAGRPPNVTETKKRKPKPTEKPSTNAFVNCLLWANEAQETINNMVTPGILNSFGKKNLRSLTREEFKQAELLKFKVLCNLEPYNKINNEIIFNILNSDTRINGEIFELSNEYKQHFVFLHNREPKVEEMRQIYSSAYSTYYTGDKDGDD